MEDSNGNKIIKSRGIGKDLAGKDILSFEDFIQIFTGEGISVKKTKFMIKEDGVYILPHVLNVKIKPSVYANIRSEIYHVLRNGSTKDPVRYSLVCRILGKYGEIMEGKKKFALVPYNEAC
jgi:hypothetical protein